MTNIRIEARPDGTVALVFDPRENHGPSSTGKTLIVATSHGAARLEGQPDETLRFNLTVYRKA